MMKKNNEESSLRKHIEDALQESLDNGEDISCYLYLPASLMSSKVKEQLDIFLMENVYKQIVSGNLSKESFVVYKDDTLKVKMEKPEKQMQLLERMMAFYLEKEEYEKCSNIKSLIEKIK